LQCHDDGGRHRDARAAATPARRGAGRSAGPSSGAPDAGERGENIDRAQPGDTGAIAAQDRIGNPGRHCDAMPASFIRPSSKHCTPVTRGTVRREAMTDIFEHTADLHLAGGEAVRFSYSRPEQAWSKRLVIRAVERLTGQPRLERLYRGWARNAPGGETI